METQIVVRADGTPAVRQVQEKPNLMALGAVFVALLGLLVVPYIVIPVAIWFWVSYNINRGPS